MVRPIVGTGTPETRWQQWPAMRDWPDLPLDPVEPPLVVAPHPDDEILGVAGLMAMLGRADLVAVTDGEASHPHSTVHTPAELAAIRRVETTDALDRLGLSGAPVHRLGHPDGGIDEKALTRALADLLTPGRWCLATWREDGHPDHEAVGRAAAAACASTGARLLEYPIWTWHWAEPDEAAVPWHRARRIALTPAAMAAKVAAIAAFPSQIAPLGPAEADAAILPPHVLARFTRPFEVVFS
ncbi:PIG-L deacetylase family protein [Actinoplanes couchii]|uniref:Acetylglucosaminylphosphatidylinositol deacetylase n=1 Tax=Actinoplanes couchii TaxID=403638 RepID=A0ABQ3XT13_9ACTN|nr:PIG-L family deacetylase [Actinoplanes couchii]MDR6319951.1 LmbE family N-acetylglucosaminyl deacetylase [Actinoplanes couchii]GID61667.1 acetylglucosaminylphosphatidylinositol deacetylase [Actinoplanes couchii]